MVGVASDEGVEGVTGRSGTGTNPISTRAADVRRSPAVMLGLATAGFAINVWAWALLSPGRRRQAAVRSGLAVRTVFQAVGSARWHR